MILLRDGVAKAEGKSPRYLALGFAQFVRRFGLQMLGHTIDA